MLEIMSKIYLDLRSRTPDAIDFTILCQLIAIAKCKTSQEPGGSNFQIQDRSENKGHTNLQNACEEELKLANTAFSCVKPKNRRMEP